MCCSFPYPGLCDDGMEYIPMSKLVRRPVPLLGSAVHRLSVRCW